MTTHGPYTPVRQAGDTYYVSGQVGVDTATGNAASSIEKQTKQVLQNMQNRLKEVGLTMDNVVRVNIYLTDINKFSDVNAVYETFFQVPRPARACVEVSDLPHIGNVPLLVEMDAVAYKEQV